MAGGKRLSQKHRVIDAEGVGLGLVLLPRRVGDGTACHVQSCMLSRTTVLTLEGTCWHGLCAESSVLLLFACHTVTLYSHPLDVPSQGLIKSSGWVPMFSWERAD